MPRAVFSGIYLKNVYVPNRIIFPAMDLELWEEGRPSASLINFYRSVALGGAGLIFTGPAYPHISGKPGPRTPGLDSDKTVRHFRKLVNVIKSSNAVPAVQLLHAGRYAGSRVTGGKGPVAPSPVPSPILFRETPRELQEEEIWMLIKSYGDAAERAEKSGHSLVEIHAGMGYLPAQFLSPLTNKRGDMWGGSLRNRARFLLTLLGEVVSRVKIPVSVRYSLLDFLDNGLSLDDSKKVLKWVVDRGVALINLVFGWHESPIPLISREVPPGGFARYCRSLRELLGVPIAYGTRVTNLRVAARIISEGLADMVAIGRALIADPMLPKKERAGVPVRPCIACSHCLSAIFSGKRASCVVNPSMLNFALGTRVTRSFRIAVVGGGPAGMEAARVLATRGHKVTLFEKEGRLGGMLRYASREPYGAEFAALIEYYERELKRVGVKVILNREVKASDVENFDRIFLAMGPRLDMSWAPEDLSIKPWWEGFAEPKAKKVAIVGSNVVGIGLADYLANQGCKVTVISLDKKPGVGLEKVSRWIVIRRLRKMGVNFILGVELGGRELKSHLEEFDVTYAAEVFKPRNIGSWLSLREKLVVVGNALSPIKKAMLMQAIHSAYNSAISV